MVVNNKRKITDALRIFTLFADYYIYKILSPFKFKKINKTEIKNILIIDLLKIGDLIVTTPVIKGLKEHFPKSNIYFMVSDGYKQVLEDNPNLKEVLIYNDNPNINIQEIKKRQIDTALILHPGSYKISKILLSAKVKYRLGCANPKGLLSPKGYFLTRKVKPSSKINHAIEDNLDVSRLIGVEPKIKKLEVFYDKKSMENAQKLLNNYKIKSNNLKIIIHPGANYKTHEWDKEKFYQVAKELTQKLNAKVIITGSLDDIKLSNEIKKDLKNVYIASGLLNIKETYALVDKVDLVISVDTSMMHIASALDKKIVALFGAGNPTKWYPYTKNKIVLYDNSVCTSCMAANCIYKDKRHKECMQSITPEQVINAVKSLLKIDP